MSVSNSKRWDIYHAVHVEGKTYDQVAKEAGISAGEVRRLSEEIYRFMKDTAKAWMPRLPAVEQAALTWRYHDEQLAELFDLAMDAWRQSRGQIVTRHERAMNSYTTTKVSFGETRYLVAAARISQLRIVAAERLVKLTRNYGDPRADGSEPPPCSPPVRGCTANESESAADQQAAVSDVDVRDEPEATYDAASTVELPHFPADSDFLAPVRAAVQPLNRQQKRAREKRMRQLLRSQK